MEDDEFSFSMVDFDFGLSIIHEINDKTRYFSQMLDKQKRNKAEFDKIRESYKKNQEILQQLKNNNEQLNEKLKKANKDKEIYASNIQSITDDLRAVEKERNQFEEERDIALERIFKLQKNFDYLKNDEEKALAEIVKLQNELHEETKKCAMLESQLAMQKRELEQRLIEQETSARVRMEDQKVEIERRLCEESNNKIRKFDIAHSKMKKDFESALKIAQKEAQSLVLERDEYYAKYRKLQSELNEHKKRTHSEMQKLVAEKCREMIKELSLQKELPSQNELILRSPDFYAKKFMKNLESNSLSDVSNENRLIYEDENDKESDVASPPIKSKKGSANVFSNRRVLQPTVVTERQRNRKNATSGTTRDTLQTISQFRRQK